jgi:hypothetical protein
MSKKIDLKQYCYCETHDIFYNIKLKKEAEESRNKLLKEGVIPIWINECPLCATQSLLMTTFGPSKTRPKDLDLLDKGKKIPTRDRVIFSKMIKKSAEK